MKIFLLLIFVSFTAHASKLETFFTSLEGNWKMDVAQSATFHQGGGWVSSYASKFDASVKREASRWSFSEDMCWNAEGAEEVCSTASVTYEIQGEELSIMMDGEKLPVQVVQIDDENLGITLKTSGYTFHAVITYASGTLTQDSVTEMSDGTKEYQMLSLIKQ